MNSDMFQNNFKNKQFVSYFLKKDKMFILKIVGCKKQFQEKNF